MHQGLKTLVLNADYRPIATYPLQFEPVRKAVKKVLRGRADTVADWGVLVFNSEGLSLPAPKVIVLRRFINVYGSPKFCRRSILLRDGFCCQYCGEPFPSEELTYDHVVPRSRGGRTVWENIASACIRCNARKSNRTCAQAGMHPIRQPRAPTSNDLMVAGMKFLAPDVKETWGDWLYWNVELKA